MQGRGWSRASKLSNEEKVTWNSRLGRKVTNLVVKIFASWRKSHDLAQINSRCREFIYRHLKEVNLFLGFCSGPRQEYNPNTNLQMQVINESVYIYIFFPIFDGINVIVALNHVSWLWPHAKRQNWTRHYKAAFWVFKSFLLEENIIEMSMLNLWRL